ncbi:hypothetical protein GCM10028798_30810 [Humibacter antri]
MTEDPRIAAARYEYRRRQTSSGSDRSESRDPDNDVQASASVGEDLQTAMVETQLQQAIRRGEFDNLPGAGKPLPGLGSPHDEDWWIRRKIETEQLRGLGPAALTLRVENAELDDRLDGLAREPEVREALEDFNRRVIEARRQLQGGPPVVTPTRDIGRDVAAWRERRENRRNADRTARETVEAANRASRWRWRRRG